MKILVTGGAGYIGSVLVPKLLEKQHEVVVLDNFMHQQTSLLDCCWSPKLTVIRGDVRNDSLLESLVKEADVIIPLACLTGAPICDRDPQTANAVNFSAIQKISEWTDFSSQKLIFPTTNSGYGVGENNVYCDEHTPLRPVSLYGRLKVEIEQILLDKGAVTLRLATVFGASPRMRLDLLVNDFTYRAVNDRTLVLFEKHFKRNYIHVRDVVRAFFHTIENYSTMKENTFNVGLSDANLSKEELCQLIQKQIPQFTYTCSEIGKDPDQRNYIVSNEKIESTGFKPETSLEDGIQELLKVYQIVKRFQYSNT